MRNPIECLVDRKCFYMDFVYQNDERDVNDRNQTATR